MRELVADGADTRIEYTLLSIELRTDNLVATSVGIYRLSVESQCVKSCICERILMWPDGAWLTTSRLALASIDDIHLLYLAIIVPVVFAKVNLTFDSIAGVDNHLWRIRIILITCSLTIKLIRMLELYGSYDIESEVELAVTLIEEIVVNTTNSSIVIGISHLVEHILIERLDIIRTWSECQHILRIFERHILKLNQDNKSFLLTFPCHSQSFSKRLRTKVYLLLSL